MSKRYYLFGRPVAASLSPAMHNAALRALGLEGEYTAVDASPEEFIKTASGLITRPDFGGANVTIPHKRAAIGLCVSLSPDAEVAGAVNTLVARAATGQGVTGHNTDVTALRSLLGPHLRPSQPAGGPSAILLGAGGAAAAAVVALASPAGTKGSVDSSGLARLVILSRSAGPAEALAEKAGRLGLRAEVGPLQSIALRRAFDRGPVGVLINATSLRSPEDWAGLRLLDEMSGLVGGGETPPAVLDLVYGREPTPLLQAAGAAGCRVVDGREVLVAQGAASFTLWTGRAAPLEIMRAVVFGERSRPCYAT